MLCAAWQPDIKKAPHGAGNSGAAVDNHDKDNAIMTTQIEQGATHQPGLDDPQPAPAGYREGDLDAQHRDPYAYVWQFAGHVPNGAFIVLMGLARHADATGRVQISLKVLAEMCGFTTRNLIKHLHTLESIGAITVVRRHDVRGGRLCNLYFLNSTNKVRWFSATPIGGAR